MDELLAAVEEFRVCIASVIDNEDFDEELLYEIDMADSAAGYLEMSLREAKAGQS